jgi:4-amino-4-deoxychorismate lyase
MSAEIIRIDGRAAGELSVLDRGLQYGDGLFETIACLNGRPRLLPAHLARLDAGCARLAIASDLAAIGREVRQLADGCPRAVVKVLVTRGAAHARGYAPSAAGKATRVTLRYPWPADDPAMATQGVRVRIADLRLGENPALAGIKHLCRLEQVLARAEWQDPQVHEALMFSSSGALVSGTHSNVFLVKSGTLLTPRLDRAGVSGVMRGCVLALASDSGPQAVEARLTDEDLQAADEIFLTNALHGILPVRELAGATRGPGPVTRALQARLAAHLQAHESDGVSRG